jgi:TonB family protein
MPLRTLCLILLLTCMPLASRAAVRHAQRVNGEPPLPIREQQVWVSAVHGTQFANIPHTYKGSCAENQPPEALATPNPLLDQPDEGGKASVSFIIGTDGRVHSAFVLESAGPQEDQAILHTVSYWRYRPATCNGVPTEAEGKIEFSSR